MIEKLEAQQIALNVAMAESDCEVEIVDAETMDEPFGWVFFYRRASPPHGLVGNAPIVVDRHSGRSSVTGTSYPIEWYLHAYRELGQERFDAGEWGDFVEVTYLNGEGTDD